jgi:Metallo-beta-lactamase superfamily
MSNLPVADDFQCLSQDLYIWQCYDPTVKADLYSTAADTAAGLFLIDPVPLEPGPLNKLTAQHPIAGIVVTNSNHCRAALPFVEKFAAPLLAHPATCAECEFSPATCVPFRPVIAADFQAIEIDGAVAGEIALYSNRRGGTMIVGDALIHFEPYGFTFLPAKYCSNAKRMRQSLRQLLDYRFEHMLFAHGAPLLGAAHGRLEELLNS